MSSYQMGKLFFDVTRFSNLSAEYQKDAKAVLDRYELSQQEKEAFLNRDVSYIYNAGVHPLLLMMGCRMLGIDMGEYFAAISGKSAEGLALPRN